MLPIACDVFRFQRRSHMRLQVRPEIDIFLALTEHNGKSIYQVAHLADISASGARIYFGNIHGTSFVDGPSKNPGLEIGQVFRAVLHPPSGKCIDLKVQVRHSLKTKGDQASMTQFGVEFIDLPPVLKNRLAAMMMDLQYKILREFELTF
ncbi:MAG: hypothetical protein COT73_07130 [Bdellovibrio sp. CG10_big_fil_rev_8_21_14_0_10_47_8]|nr:MAG: hypothetical protein COT73_07130 [Bdellovibrio sp. CG10_big_fil_rev_8_21_14_0_10_47_8]